LAAAPHAAAAETVGQRAPRASPVADHLATVEEHAAAVRLELDAQARLGQRARVVEVLEPGDDVAADQEGGGVARGAERVAQRGLDEAAVAGALVRPRAGHADPALRARIAVVIDDERPGAVAPIRVREDVLVDPALVG